MKYVYGKSFSRTFYPMQDSSPVQLPSQSPTIYIFRDYPSISAAQDGTGAVATISSWTQATVTPFGCTYTVAAINNPDIDSLIPVWTYYEAINFVATAAGQVQTVIRAFELGTVEELESLPGTTIQDLKDVYPAIASYFDDTKLAAFITGAEQELKIDLEAQGFKYPKIMSFTRFGWPSRTRRFQTPRSQTSKTWATVTGNGTRFTAQDTPRS